MVRQEGRRRCPPAGVGARVRDGVWSGELAGLVRGAGAGGLCGQTVTRAKRRIVQSLDVPGVVIDETEQGVRLSGRDLWRRLIEEPRLRWIGGLFR